MARSSPTGTPQLSQSTTSSWEKPIQCQRQHHADSPQKQPGGGMTKTQYWKAKGPDAMEVDNGTSSEAKEELLEGSPHKKLTDEERAALKLLGLCYFCCGGKHLSANCPEKPPQ
jgi:hypothetical protein